MEKPGTGECGFDGRARNRLAEAVFPLALTTPVPWHNI